MGSDTATSFSIVNSQKPSNCDEIFMQHRLHFANNLKDLKNLRQQLYSAAEYFESSYDKDNNDQKQLVIESSKDYVSKALVSTVDHLGSVADKLNKFLDEKVCEFSSTNTRFYCIEERLNMFQEFVDMRGVYQHSLVSEAPEHHKQYNSPGARTSCFRKLNLVYKDCVPCPQNDMSQSKQENPFVKGFQVEVIKPPPPLLRKGDMRSFSSELPTNPVNHSFTRVRSTKETGKRSGSPPRFTLMKSGSAAYRSSSPGSSVNKQLASSESRKSIISSCMKPETTNGERQIMSYTKRSKNLLKALLSINHSRRSSR